ncbi:MAG: phosphatase PAP2 family protein [Phycisphaerales bacterium JB037]
MLGAAGLLITLPLDGPLQAGIRALGRLLGGDLLRELEVLQQYGALGSLVLIALIIWLQDVHRRARLLDLAAAIVSTGAVILLMKGLIGRVRPRGHMLDDYGPMSFLGPFGAVPGEPGQGVVRPWQFLAEGVSDIQSMPSSHTAYAVALSVFLLSMYPRLRPLLIALPIIVGACRVLFGAHWPSDVVAGAAIGAIVASASVRSAWGRRLFRVRTD